MLSLPYPDKDMFVKIEDIFLIFLWNCKIPKSQLSILDRLTSEGGLQFLNNRKIDMALVLGSKGVLNQVMDGQLSPRCLSWF